MEGCPSVQRLSDVDQFIDAHSLGLNGVVSLIYIDKLMNNPESWKVLAGKLMN